MLSKRERMRYDNHVTLVLFFLFFFVFFFFAKKGIPLPSLVITCWFFLRCVKDGDALYVSLLLLFQIIYTL